MSVKSRIQELNKRLADTLISKGVEADKTETTTSLIDKVDNINVNGASTAEHYKGDYEVEPAFTEQILRTKHLLMDENVTVKEISVTKIPNTSGGNTVIIGG